MAPARIALLFGAGSYSLTESPSYKFVLGVEKSQPIFDVFLQRGYHLLDTARIYGNGTSEKLISQLNIGNAKVDTKIWPTNPGDHKADRFKALFQESKAALGSIPIQVLYLHKPDRTVPFEETLEAADELYKKGEFKELGLSNYTAWEVAEIVGICKRRGFVQPTVYQGVYNLLQRGNEIELFPCLRKFGIRFTAYSIMAGGLLTGKHLDAPVAKGTHFDPSSPIGQMYGPKYMPLLPVVQDLKVIADKHNIKLAELAYRWIVHHSKLTPQDHGAILGASSAQQMEIAIDSCEKGPLPEDLVSACEEAWTKAQGIKRDDAYFM